VRLLFSAAFDTRANVGISAYIQHIVPELARLCELTVLTPDPDLFMSAFRVIRIPEFTHSHPGRVIWTISMLERYCTRDFDAVLCPTPAVPVNSSLPAVAVVHDLTPLMLPRLHPARLKALFWLGLQSLRRAAAVITDSASTRSDLLARSGLVSPESVAVVHPGPGIIPMDRNQDSTLAARLAPYILYVGGHARHKNLPRLVAAFAILHSRPLLKLVITGWSKPDLIDRTRRAVLYHGLQQRVIIVTDRLAEPQLSSLYHSCAAFVYPSLYEGFGLPVLEALAHGAPVACSCASSLPEVGGNAAIYFDPTTVRDIAEKLGMITDDEALARRLRRAGPLRASEFSWTEAASATLRVVGRAVALHSG